MITRRESLKLGIAGLAGLGASHFPPSVQAGPVRPNTEQLWRTGWPMFTGPNGNFSVAPSGTSLIEDLRQARQLWQSQENDIGDAKKISQAVACEEKRTLQIIQRLRDARDNLRCSLFFPS